METTDLMIGNVVRDNQNRTAHVNSLNPSCIAVSFTNYDTIVMTPNAVSGYPIDDDVLIKLGFFKYQDNVFSCSLYDIIKEDGGYTFIGSKVSYIHEIQNIMKVVFNEELPVNINEL